LNFFACGSRRPWRAGRAAVPQRPALRPLHVSPLKAKRPGWRGVGRWERWRLANGECAMASYGAKRVLEALVSAIFMNSMFGKISRTAGWFAFFLTTKRKTKTFSSPGITARGNGPTAAAPIATGSLHTKCESAIPAEAPFRALPAMLLPVARNRALRWRRSTSVQVQTNHSNACTAVKPRLAM
jgi:hypothetical protein